MTFEDVFPATRQSFYSLVPKTDYARENIRLAGSYPLEELNRTGILLLIVLSNNCNPYRLLGIVNDACYDKGIPIFGKNVL